MANLSWQTRVEKFHKMANSLRYTSKSRQITKRGNWQHGRLWAVALTKNGETEDEKRRNRNRRRNKKVWTRPRLSASSSIFHCVVLGQSGPGNSNSVISNSKPFPLDLFFSNLLSAISDYFSIPLRVKKTEFKYIFVGYRRNVPRTQKTVNLFDKFKSGLTYILTYVRYFGVKQINHVNRACV